MAPARRPRVREGRGSGAGVRADPDAKRSSSDDHDREALEAYAFSHQCPQAARRPAGDSTDGRRSDRKSVVEGKRVSVRVDLGGRRIIKKKDMANIITYMYVDCT